MKKFQVIVADPPWNFKDSLTMSDVPRGAAANYHLMKNSDIESLPIADYADPKGCVLALWVPGSLLQEGLNTMKAWGFEQKQIYVWVKTKKQPLKEIVNDVTSFVRDGSSLPNIKKWIKSNNFRSAIAEVVNYTPLAGVLSFYMGRLFRQTHEVCLIGTSSNLIYKKLEDKSQRSVCFGENLEHSAKPEALQNSLEIMFPKTKKLELFARRTRPGWVCLGDEVCKGEDIRDSLKKL